MSKVVLFGAGKIAEEVYVYLTKDSEHEVVAFTVNADYLHTDRLFGKPLVPFEKVTERYPPSEFDMFVALGYQGLNRLRESKYHAAKQKGYRLISYVCSRASNFGDVALGDNVLVLENTVIQPLAKIGSNVFLWSGNHIGHHAAVSDHCYVCGHVIIGGSTRIGSHCFLGINATIGHEVTIGSGSLIGANALITKNVAPGSVHIAADAPKFRLDATAFLKLTKMQ